MPKIIVKSRAPQFFRAGYKFTQEPRVIDVADLTDAQLAAIRAERELVVTDVGAAPEDAEKAARIAQMEAEVDSAELEAEHAAGAAKAAQEIAAAAPKDKALKAKAAEAKSAAAAARRLADTLAKALAKAKG